MREPVNMRKKSEKGLTYIEVLVTMVILAVVLVALLSCFLHGFNVLSRIRQMSIATQSIQEELERIRNMSYNDVLALGTSFTNESLSLLENGSGVLSLEDSLGDDIKKLTVSILWSYREMEMRKDVVTFITKKGINRK
ncbi:MAG: prepilin-type N-terminal cleavage/methylation domain-containing protein [Candidatus Aminicenantes bacterium]|nr:prepilin-type N-terminal cleavage/methylation domain-containing protein [Candidatus Aminicenantes bacterium]